MQSLSKELSQERGFAKDTICHGKANLGVTRDQLSDWADGAGLWSAT